ncbi:MAG TPA: FecR domain-containing protein [Steroidobacter sp.]
MAAPSGLTEHDPALLKALAEASAWIATLHGPERTPAVERGLQCWLAESPIHRYAFEHATDTWSKTRAAVRRSAQVEIRAPDLGSIHLRRMRTLPFVAVAASVLIAVLGVGIYLDGAGLKTAVGERRTLVLEDGTQVTLNTKTRMSVDYNEHRRHVRLEAGEAIFEVAKRPRWPFVVTAGDREVTALGTAFLVRRDSGQLAVTLLEGKVAVTSSNQQVLDGIESPIDLSRVGATHPTTTPDAAAGGTPITLAPGERIVFAEHATPVVDRPELEKLTAWQQGLVNIDDLTLAQAMEEMNRYSKLQLSVDGPAANIRVSGVFRVTDSESMARAVALTHGLELRKEGRRIILSGTPVPPSESRLNPASFAGEPAH